MHKVFNNKFVIFSLVLPGMILFLFAILAPLLLSFYYGMTEWSGIGKPNFIMFQNYKHIFTDDPAFWRALLNALVLGIALIVIQHPICMFFAILLDKMNSKTEKFFRAIFFVPCIISVVVTSKMWVNILSYNYGLLNKFLDATGMGILKQDWLGDPRTALGSIVFIIMWQGFGWALLIYYAGLKGIPEELFESARIEGAAGVKMHSKITIPVLMPVIRINVTLAIISALKQMETVFLIANYLYNKAFSSFEYGYGNAISVIFVLFCLLITFITDKTLKKDVGEY